jgi:uncharacterized membrane protein YbhN (UPF0104 family)
LDYLLATRCFNCYDAQKQDFLRNIGLSQDGEKKIKRHILNLLRIFVAGGALFLAFKNQNMAELGEQLLQLNPWIFGVAVGLFLFSQVLFVIRWRLLLRVLSIHISLWVGLKLHFLGWFYNNALPSSVGGDLLRAWYVTHHCDRDKRTEAALSVFFDRAIGLTGMILMASACYWLIPVEEQFTVGANEVGEKTGIFNSISESRLVLAALAAGIVAVFCAIGANKKGRALLVGLWGRFCGIAVKGISAVKLFGKKPVTIICTLGLTVFLQGISILGFWLLGRNLGIESPIKYYFVFFPVSWLIGTIPISIGGLGVIEGTLKFMFKTVGVLEANASAIAVCQRLVWWVSSLPGVFIHLSGAHLPTEKTDFFVDSVKDVD